ncbi:Endonuclease/exonuclease/phosphatase [Dimargaris cristalligena]|uniref:Endonuclease/exonuclease/phosphatase n=1 Tax=Dimargaris cristalligena TaxID=215637 RepID=A0A4P9ZWS6_9FUNG|nr:Endonuclease/exonuclease/phosphatase [Dimargaris cristalligena]|eukprot:RKP38125.1 Endonuclease/exonuclease/phosphatase [Dimargaris cristalligena]
MSAHQSAIITPRTSPDSAGQPWRSSRLLRHKSLLKPGPPAIDSQTLLSPDLSDSDSVSDVTLSEPVTPVVEVFPAGFSKLNQPPGLPLPSATSRQGKWDILADTKSSTFAFGSYVTSSPKTTVESLPSNIWNPSTVFKVPELLGESIAYTKTESSLLESSSYSNRSNRSMGQVDPGRLAEAVLGDFSSTSSPSPFGPALFRVNSQPLTATHSSFGGELFKPLGITRSSSHSMLDSEEYAPPGIRRVESMGPMGASGRTDPLLSTPGALNLHTQSFDHRLYPTSDAPSYFPVSHMPVNRLNDAASIYGRRPAVGFSCDRNMGFMPNRTAFSTCHRTPEIPLHPTFQNRNQAIVSGIARRVQGGPTVDCPIDFAKEWGVARRMVIRDAEMYGALHEMYLNRHIKPGFSQFNPRTFTTMSWNIAKNRETFGLGESNSRQTMDSSMGRESMLDMVGQMDADFLCLQEVPLQDFSAHYEPRLAQRGYAGVYQHPNKGVGQVHGCAIFYRPARFELTESYAIRFNEAAFGPRRMGPALVSVDVSSRFMPFHNIAIIAVFTNRQTNSRLRLVNTQLADNDIYPDVKLLQGAILVDHLTYRHEAKLSTIICGDFHSLPKSDVVRYLLAGRVSRNIFRNHDYGKYSAYPLKHPLRLRNAYHQSAMSYTYYNDQFAKLTSDYLLYTTPTLRMLAFYDAMPILHSFNPAPPSHSHMPLVALFEEKPNVTLAA